MNGRSSSSNLLADENGHLRSKEQGRKREWVPRLSRMLILFIVLGLGVLLGVMVSLHILGYFEGSILGGRCANGFHNWLPTTKPAQGWFLPSNLQHGMPDEELLWRASIGPHRPGLPIKRTPKIAFMFLTKGPLPFAKLWERYFKGHTDLLSIYVHAPPGYRLDVPYSSPFYGRQIPSQEARWGEMSIIDAERRLLANALLDFSNERFVLVSESCIPVRNFTNYLQLQFGDELAGRSITWVDWSRGGAHPATYNKNDIDLNLVRRMKDDRGCVLFGELNQPCWFFARKFAPSSLEPLLALSAELFAPE
ncbi:hypothetical protein R1sor_009451 [Riccia sorocarpa]|uniref:Uncharacterized protein n=1 Tax=Riccia sorocarpa TaxID=122646 RepID=A0ABD3HZ54_9MARC